MVNPLQLSRQKNIDFVKKLIGETKPESIDRAKLERAAMIKIGCTESKAKEYIRIVLGEMDIP